MRRPALFRQFAAAPQGAINDPPRGEAGADADMIVSGLMAGGPDDNPELTGSLKFGVYRQMVRSDATVKGVTAFVKLPVRAAVWTLEPKTGDPDARVVRDCVNAQFGIEDEEDGWLDLSWDGLTAQGLSMVEYGLSFEELVWGDVRVWRDADGDEHLVRPLDRLAPRRPTTILRAPMRNGRVTELVQNLAGTTPIPAEKLVHMVFEHEPGTWEGVSMIRACWAAWALKKHIMILTGINWDRFAVPTPLVWHPRTSDGEAKAREIGRDLRSGERAYVHFPSDGPGPSGVPESEWFMRVLEGAIADPVGVLKYLSDQIAEVGLAQFSRQGLGETGARASAEAQIDPYYLGVQTLAGNIRRERSRQVIRKFVQVNFGDEAADRLTPKLCVSKIQADNVTVIAQAVNLLSDAIPGFVNDQVGVDSFRALVGVAPQEDDPGRALTGPAVMTALQGMNLPPDVLAQISAAIPAGNGRRPGGEGNGLS